MIILIQRICIAFRGEGRPKAVATLAMVRAAKDVDNWKARKARMLKNMPMVWEKVSFENSKVDQFHAVNLRQEHTFSFSDSIRKGLEIIFCKDNIRGFFTNVRAALGRPKKK